MSLNLPNRTRLTLAAQNKSFISIEITNSGDNNTFEFEKEDFKPETMEIANAQVIGIIEEDKKNKYTLKIGSNIKSLQVNGKPASIEDGGVGGEFTYSNEFNDSSVNKALADFINTSNNTSNFDFEVIKGLSEKTSENQIEYHKLLLEVSNDPSNNRIIQNISRIAENENGGNSPKKPYIAIDQKEKESGIGKITLQNRKGIHIPNSEEQTRIQLTLENLKNFGMQLMLKSSGEYVNVVNQDNPEQYLAARAGSLIPGLARLGFKIPCSDLDLESIAKDANPNYIKSNSEFLKQDNALSFGQYNNPLVPFYGIDSRSSIAAAAILIATLTKLFEVLSVTFAPKEGLQNTTFIQILNEVNNITITTKNDYSECVKVGMQIFFSGKEGNFEEFIKGTFHNLSEAIGYYNTILRNLVRSITHEIAQQLFAATIPPGAIDGVIGPYDTNTATNIKPAGVSYDVGSNILGAIRKISQSKIVSFMNVLANIGDIAIAIREKPISSLPPNISDLVNDTYQTEEGNRINPAAFIRNQTISSDAASYLQLPHGTLSWAASTSPSKYILPNSILTAARELGDTNSSERLLSKLSKGNEHIIESTQNRLSDEVVREIEDLLEVSYVPFYFHDLRTNEIISFHAFLKNITDSFSVDYADNTGYGRIGKIFSYRNTDRTIGLSFIVAATNQEDFDRMWWKINKLIMLVYPQYTAGRVVEYEGRRFTQPFSQIISASPLVRIRLGDILKSNFSKFGLARLFGLGQGQDKFSINNQQIEQNRASEQALQNAIEEVRSRMSRNDFAINERFYFQYVAPAAAARSTRRQTPGIPYGEPNNTYELRLVQNSRQLSSPIQQISSARINEGNLQNTGRELVSGRYLLRVIERSIGTSSTENTILYKVQIDDLPAAARSTQYWIRLPIGNQINELQRSANIGFYEPDIIAAARSSIRNSAQEDNVSPQDNNSSDLVRDFFDANKNPIFKAFESTKGRGLAGFIKAINFSWDEITWELDGLGRRAPIMAEINIEFAPIYDISPGIDNNGFMTAPVYGVGELSNALGNSVEKDYSENQNILENYSRYTYSQLKLSSRG